MKLLRNFLLPAVLAISLGFTACKNKANKDTSNPNVDTTATITTPVQVDSDESLKNGVKDATKDYPAVTAAVNDGEITLTGDISRDKLPKLMQSLNSLHPKKINNNLTIK